MQVPVVSSFLELSNAPRRFLFFTAFNVVSWQCIVGPAMILFARRIDMPASWVGFLISFMPFSTLLVVFTAPMVARFGAKRLMFTTWLLRNLVMCVVFLMPWVLTRGEPRLGWYLLMGATLAFCIFRALGAGGWFPWLHEVVPPPERGAYFSAEAASTQLVNVCIILTQGLMLIGEPGVERFLYIYAVGVIAGLVSLVWMSRVPGGAGLGAEVRLFGALEAHRRAAADRPFLVFVMLAALCFSCTAWLGSAYVLYLRDALLLTPRRVMLLTAAGSVGVLLTIRYWGRFADHSGSGRAMLKTLIGHSLGALAFLALPPGAWWTPWAMWPVVVLTSIFGAAFWMAAHRAMLNYVKEDGRVGYTNLWTVGTALTLGGTPIAAGWLIQHWGLWGFRACFLISGAAGMIGALACDWIVRDGPQALRARAWPLDPMLPVRTLVRIAWITVGLHESNRPRPHGGPAA